MHRTTPITSVHSAAYYIYYSMLSDDTTSTVYSANAYPCVPDLPFAFLPARLATSLQLLQVKKGLHQTPVHPTRAAPPVAATGRHHPIHTQTPLMNQDSLTALQATQHALSTHQVPILLMFSACLVTCVHTVTLHKHKM